MEGEEMLPATGSPSDPTHTYTHVQTHTIETRENRHEG